MEVWGGGFEKPELVSLAEQIHKLKNEKFHLELELSEQKFKYRYIPQRKELAGHQLRNLLLLILPVTFIIVFMDILSIGLIMQGDHSRFAGLTVLAAGLLMIYGGYFDFVLIRQAIPLVKILTKGKKGKHDIKNTIEEDNYKTKTSIEYLIDEINKLSNEIIEKQERQRLLLEEKERNEKILRDKGILFDVAPDTSKNKESGLALKDDNDLDAYEIAQLYEYLQREESYTMEIIRQLEGQLEHANRDLVNISEEFEHTKIKIFISVIAFIVIVIIQTKFTGSLQVVTSLLCLFFSILYVLNLERTSKRAVLDYLIERDSPLTREYAFRNNAVPIKEKRREIIEQIDQYKNELKGLKEQREALDFS